MPYVQVNGVGVPAEWVEIDGLSFLRNVHTKQWLPTQDDTYTKGPYGVCPYCGQRPCVDACPEPAMPDRLEWKARRAGLSVDGWLARYEQDHDGESWLARYPFHPAAMAWRRDNPEMRQPAPTGPAHQSGQEQA